MSNTTLIKIVTFTCAAILAIFAVFPCYAQPMDIEHIYPLTTIIRDIDPEQDIVYAEDCNGNIWTFYGVEDWDIDDICSMIIYDNDTDIIYDDIILKVQYGGYAAGLL